MRSPSNRSSESPEPLLQTIPEILAGETVLVTGGAGFVGSALLYRLSAPELGLRRVFTIIRGENPISRLPQDLHSFIATRDENGILSDAPIVILGGDCFLPGFGLDEHEQKYLRTVSIVIHCAGDTRFTLPLSQAVRAISDLAYSMCQFSFSSQKVRTHIHLSTCFVSWFLPSGSVAHEELVPSLDPNVKYEDHANTYLHAKSIAEGVVNAIARPQAGRGAAKLTTWRILRLSTIGPASHYPYPGWGAGSTSSPVCGAVAAQVVDKEHYHRQAELDVLPVDIAVNQIIALTAACHATSNARRTNAQPFGTNVPIYNLAAGLSPTAPIPMDLLNDPSTKLADPYIPEKNMLRAYLPMISKCIKFDTTRARQVLGLPTYSPKLGGGKIGLDKTYGETEVVTESTIDCAGYLVDVEEAVAQVGGWQKYLQCIRDRMEREEEPESFESHVD